jgi:hypothetical protein
MTGFYGFLPSYGILNNYKTQRSGNWISFALQVSGGRHLICWVPYKELRSVTGPFRPEHGNRSNFRNIVFSSYLEFRKMDKGHKPSDSEESTLFVCAKSRIFNGKADGAHSFRFTLAHLTESSCSSVLVPCFSQAT